MDENKSTVLPAKHVVEIRYGKFKMKLYNPNSVTLSVSIRKATKEDM
ncbi:MAG: hypothetical protein KGI06_03210 [Candidatus Micrarchaeota archaeon]|nr:hypothetical protein [Candidatus Micrarchaeota archaeon]